MAELTFEIALKRLEEIVTLLERGDCPLDDAVNLYDEGLKLSAFCDKKLSVAKQKITDIEEYIKDTDTNE